MNVRFVEDANGVRRNMTKEEGDEIALLPVGAKAYRYNPLTSARPPQENDVREYGFEGQVFTPGKRTFSTNLRGLDQLNKANRLFGIGKSLTFVRYFNDFAFKPRNDIWDDTRQSGYGDEKVYVVQTASRAIERCILMATDPGDLVLDPTCGSGTTATVANNWGVQTGAGPQRTVGNVCSWNASPSGGAAPYWQCTGTAAQPFPR